MGGNLLFHLRTVRFKFQQKMQGETPTRTRKDGAHLSSRGVGKSEGLEVEGVEANPDASARPIPALAQALQLDPGRAWPGPSPCQLQVGEGVG